MFVEFTVIPVKISKQAGLLGLLLSRGNAGMKNLYKFCLVCLLAGDRLICFITSLKLLANIIFHRPSKIFYFYNRRRHLLKRVAHFLHEVLKEAVDDLVSKSFREHFSHDLQTFLDILYNALLTL